MKIEYLGNEGYPGFEYREEVRYNEAHEEVLLGVVTNGKDIGFAGTAPLGKEKELREELIERLRRMLNGEDI